MRTLLALAIAILPSVVFAQAEEDAEHRADRARTEQLNRNAAAAVDRRNGANADAVDRYRDAQAAYRRAREEWRRRLAACEEGDDRACGPD
ncbi:hypothetical protein [Sphingomonas crusticola]|uniref:hypothetical protein n=1 Tax=Sphingomonas crusticola TaxID=1697973 RepID=UPI000E2838E7|nr:hypothetical protein [Sphingomonas crusticola]